MGCNEQSGSRLLVGPLLRYFFLVCRPRLLEKNMPVCCRAEMRTEKATQREAESAGTIVEKSSFLTAIMLLSTHPNEKEGSTESATAEVYAALSSRYL